MLLFMISRVWVVTDQRVAGKVTISSFDPVVSSFLWGCGVSPFSSLPDPLIEKISTGGGVLPPSSSRSEGMSLNKRMAYLLS